MNLSVCLGKLRLRNPLIIASGVFSLDAREFFPLPDVGAIVTKTITLYPREGNPPPRLWETPSGVMNSIGLQNKGFKYFLEEELKIFLELGPPIIVSLGGESEEEFLYMAENLKGTGIAGVELNLSCPNVSKGGMYLGMDPATVKEIVKGVKSQGLWVMPKLTPQAPDIVETALAGEEGGADAVSLINTVLAMSIDVKRRTSRLGTLFGGLSGPAIRPLALRMVYQVAQKVKIPVVGGGGITDWESALEFIIAGADAVQIGTACLVDPHAPSYILRGIEEFMKVEGIEDIKTLKGSFLPPTSGATP